LKRKHALHGSKVVAKMQAACGPNSGKYSIRHEVIVSLDELLLGK